MVDDVTDKAEKTSATEGARGDEDTGALLSDVDLSIEEQLAIVEDDIVAKDSTADGTEEGKKAAGSEEPDETVGKSTAKEGIPSEFRSAVKEEVTLQMRVSQLEAENAELKGGLAEEDADDDDDDDDFDYDVGDIDESLEAMRDPLNRMGKFQIAETRKIARAIEKLTARLDSRDRLMDAQQIKSDLKIEPSEEDAIVEWAQDKGLRYHDRKSLAGVVDMYRTDQELKALKEKQATRRKATANPRTSSSKSTSSTDDDMVETGQTFEDSFEKAVKITNEKIKRGELR